MAAFETQFPRSEALMRRAVEVMPGGNTRTTALPVGLQLVGRWHEDALVLRAAAAFEQLSSGAS